MAGGLTDEGRREALLDQLRYLLLEAEAVAPMLARLPAWVLTESPTGERTVLETFAHLAALDREVYLPRLRAAVAGEEAPGTAADPDGLVHPELERALADVREAREALAAAFEAASPETWARNGLADLALEVVHRDAELLRTLAYRMHESNITLRDAEP